MTQRKHFAILVAGPPECGKTSLLMEIVARTRRVLIYDSTGEWRGDRYAYSLPGLTEHLRHRVEGRTVYRPCGFTDQGEFEPFAKAVFRYAYEVGGTGVCCDEIAGYVSARGTGTFSKALFARGRHYGIHPIAASQWLVDLPVGLKNCLTHFATFRHTDISQEERALKWFPDIEPLYRKLAPRQYVMWTKNGPPPYIGTVDPGRARAALAGA